MPVSPSSAAIARSVQVKVQSSTHAAHYFIPNFELHSVLLIGVVVMTMVAGSVHAQPATPAAAERNSPPSQISPRTTAGDTPAIPSNKVSSQEVDAAFDRADSNRDGKLDRREAEHFPAVAQRFDQIDSNKDGYVSRDELKKMAGY